MLIKFSNFFTRGNTIEYQYNCQNKLIKGIYPNDAAGNILNKETKNLQNDDEYLGLQLYAYNRNNEISSAFDGTYLYDENGNLIKDCYGTAYTYDCYNRVATVTKSDGTAISYTYSTENVRTSKTLGNHTTRYCYDTNGNILMEKTDGTVERIYVWGSEILGMMVPTLGGYELYGYFQNAHGDVTGLYQGDYCYAEYDYDAYGNVVSCSETDISNPIRYAGYYYDTDTQNYYLMNRYYSPYQGRFLTLDPYWNVSNMLYGKFTGTVQKRVYYPAVVQSGNRFAYCAGNPMKWYDPWGLISEYAQAYIDYYEYLNYETNNNNWEEYNLVKGLYVQDGRDLSEIYEDIEKTDNYFDELKEDIIALDDQGLIKSTVLEVPIFNQLDYDNGDNLCWATCNAMAMAYILNDKENRTLAIAIKVAESTDEPDNYNVPRPWISMSTLDFGINNSQVQIGRILTSDEIKDMINEGKTFGVLYGKHYFVGYNQEWSGHWILGIGYAQAPGHDILVISNDPWGGVQRIQHYNDFIGPYVGDSQPWRPWAETAIEIGR